MIGSVFILTGILVANKRVVLSMEEQAWLMLVVVPVNSAINPLLAAMNQLQTKAL